MNLIYIARVISATICTIGIGALIIGAMHLQDCAFNPMIPTWLLVYGLLVTVRLPCILPDIIGLSTPQVFKNFSCLTIFLFSVFDFIWLIYGTFLVITKSPNMEIKGAADYCERTTFIFSRVTVGLFWVLNLVGCCINYDEVKSRQFPPLMATKQPQPETDQNGKNAC